jgi:ribonucleoside-diphosphate reductase subunit M1
MYAQKQSHEGKAAEMNGMPTPTATPPPNMEHKQLTHLTKTRLSEESSSEEPSPTVLPTDPTTKPEVEALDEPKQEQVEDADDQREGDIYAEAVLACELNSYLQG